MPTSFGAEASFGEADTDIDDEVLPLRGGDGRFVLKLATRSPVDPC